MYEKEIDWSGFTFSEDTCTCRCGAVFQSHAKAFYDIERVLVTRRPCPGCGQNDNCNHIESPPEPFTLRK